MLNFLIIPIVHLMINKRENICFNDIVNRISSTYITLWGVWGGTVIYTKCVLYVDKNYNISYKSLLHSGLIGGVVSYYTYNKLFLT